MGRDTDQGYCCFGPKFWILTLHPQCRCSQEPDAPKPDQGRAGSWHWGLSIGLFPHISRHGQVLLSCLDTQRGVRQQLIAVLGAHVAP
jgi:hypothetical protein